jgi:hypothetical protein
MSGRISRWVRIFGALLFALVAGCAAKVDAESNRVVTDRVWFCKAGHANCPHCAPEVKLACAECYRLRKERGLPIPEGADESPSLVKPHSNVCAQDAHHPVIWTSERVPCWKCSGSGLCKDCRGTGSMPNGRPCVGCIRFDEDGRPEGTGRCAQCRGSGLVEYGAQFAG